MCHLQKIFITFSRVRKIQDLGHLKYKQRLFSKRTHGILKIIFLGFLCILSRPGKENWKFPFFWVFIILKKQCDQFLMKMNPCKIFYFQGLFLPLKVSQSRKQFMVASILPKNKRNGLRIVSGYAFEIF